MLPFLCTKILLLSLSVVLTCRFMHETRWQIILLSQDLWDQKSSLIFFFKKKVIIPRIPQGICVWLLRNQSMPRLMKELVNSLSFQTSFKLKIYSYLKVVWDSGHCKSQCSWLKTEIIGILLPNLRMKKIRVLATRHVRLKSGFFGYLSRHVQNG